MDENFRNKLLLLLKKKIEDGDFDYSYSDCWHEESWEAFNIEPNENIEESKITYKFESSNRDLADEEWTHTNSVGEASLGHLLDVLLFVKFGNLNMEKQRQDKLNYIFDGLYTIHDGMTITNGYGEELHVIPMEGRRAMFLKILDVYDEVTDDVEFGTCELCFSMGPLYQKFIKVEYGSEVFDVELGAWSWGDYEEDIPDIDNIIKFNDFVMTQPIRLKKNGYNNTYNINDIHSTLVSLMEYYDVFHQQDELKGDELLNKRLMCGVKNDTLSIGNYHNQDGGLQKIMAFIHNHEYYELNWFIYESVNAGWEYKRADSEADQEWQYEQMMKYIDKYLLLTGEIL